MERVHELRPTVWVGKHGLTGEVIREIVEQLEARGMVKVRFLRTAEMDVDALVGATKAHIVETRGRNVVLEKKNRFLPRNI